MKLLFSVAAMALLLLGCSSDSDEKPSTKAVTSMGDVGDPCRYGKRSKNVFVAVKHYSGPAYRGDFEAGDLEKVRPKWGGATPRRLATATAAPSVNVWRVRVSDNCYDPKRKIYYNCTKTLRANLSPIRAMVRAARHEDARRLAVHFCQQRVIQAVAKQIGPSHYRSSLGCRIIDDRWCKIPRALRGKKAAKKAN